MLTPLDIQNKEFTKGFRGYIEIEVDSFLDEVIQDFEYIFKENLELKSKIDMLTQQIDYYGSMEATLQKTLVVAQTTAEDVINTARQKGEDVIRDSNRRAEQIMESAREQVIDSKKEYERVRREILTFRTKYKSLLNQQLETMDHYGEEESVLSVLDEMKNSGRSIDTENSFIPESKMQEPETQASEYEEAYVGQGSGYEDLFEQEEPKQEEVNTFAEDMQEQQDEIVASYQGEENLQSESLEEEVNPFAEEIQEEEIVASYQGSDNMYADIFENKEEESTVGSYEEVLGGQEQEATYQGTDNMYSDIFEGEEDSYEEDVQVQSNEYEATYQGAESMYSDSLGVEENLYKEDVEVQENKQEPAYQGNANMYLESLQLESNSDTEDVEEQNGIYLENLQGQEESYTEGYKGPGSAFADKLEKQRKQREQERLYNENKVNQDDDMYEEEIQNIYGSVDKQKEKVSEY